MIMKNSTYDKLRWIAQYLIPALGTLYFALASIWGFPCGEQVVGTLAAVNTFLGVTLGISSYNYNKQGDEEPEGEFPIKVVDDEDSHE